MKFHLDPVRWALEWSGSAPSNRGRCLVSGHPLPPTELSGGRALDHPSSLLPGLGTVASEPSEVNLLTINQMYLQEHVMQDVLLFFKVKNSFSYYCLGQVIFVICLNNVFSLTGKCKESRILHNASLISNKKNFFLQLSQYKLAKKLLFL